MIPFSIWQTDTAHVATHAQMLKKKNIKQCFGLVTVLICNLITLNTG